MMQSYLMGYSVLYEYNLFVTNIRIYVTALNKHSYLKKDGKQFLDTFLPGPL